MVSSWGAATNSISQASKKLHAYTLTCFQEIFSKLSVCILFRLLPGQMENTGLSYLSSSVWRSNYQSSTGHKDCILLFFKCHHPLRYDNKTLRNLVSKSSKRCAEVSLQSHGTHLKNSICASQSTVAQRTSPLLAATTIVAFVHNQVLVGFKA